MQQTRKEFLDEFLGFVGELGDGDARDVADALLNRTYQTIWLKFPWPQFVSPAQLELTLTGSQRSYAMPDHFGRFGKGPIRNLTKGNPLTPMDLELIRQEHPEQGTSKEIAGEPELYALNGVTGVSTQPNPAGEALEVLSDSASDIDIRVEVAGDTPSGVWTREQVTLTGVTPVAIGTWGYIDEFSKTYPDGTDPATPLTSSRGTVTLRKVTAGTVLQRLFSAESAREHKVLTIYPKPSAIAVLGIPFLRKPKRLVNDADLIPLSWGPALFEEMVIQWRTNTGEIAHDGNVRRPVLEELIAHENAARSPRRTKPFRA